MGWKYQKAIIFFLFSCGGRTFRFGERYQSHLRGAVFHEIPAFDAIMWLFLHLLFIGLYCVCVGIFASLSSVPNTLCGRITALSRKVLSFEQECADDSPDTKGTEFLNRWTRIMPKLLFFWNRTTPKPLKVITIHISAFSTPFRFFPSIA